MKTSQPTRAVVILANDGVANWLAPCLASLRLHSPEIRCVIIPFSDDKLDLTLKIVKHFNVEVYRPTEVTIIDQLATQLYPGKEWIGCFRKFAAFYLGVDSVLFSDADIVYLKPVEALFEKFEKTSFSFLYADFDISYVYLNSTVIEKMTSEFDAKGFNTGFWIAKGNLLGIPDIREAIARLVGRKEDILADSAMEQPFLNYCLDTGRVKYAHFEVAVPDFPLRNSSTTRLKKVNSEWKVIGDLGGGTRTGYMLHWYGSEFNWHMGNRLVLFKYYLIGSELKWKSVTAIGLLWEFIRYRLFWVIDLISKKLGLKIDLKINEKANRLEDFLESRVRKRFAEAPSAVIVRPSISISQ